MSKRHSRQSSSQWRVWLQPWDDARARRICHERGIRRADLLRWAVRACVRYLEISAGRFSRETLFCARGIAVKHKIYKRLRQEMGTQAEVAEMLGITRETLAHRERGKTKIAKEAGLALLFLYEEKRRQFEGWGPDEESE